MHDEDEDYLYSKNRNPNECTNLTQGKSGDSEDLKVLDVHRQQSTSSNEGQNAFKKPNNEPSNTDRYK